MPKRVHDENSADNAADEEAPPAKAPASTAACEFCGQTFTTRGMTRHQNKCAKKQAHDIAAAKKPRCYRFSILNEGVFENILKFLGNQTLTKLQMVTGDRYAKCEAELAKFCCKCENDNPVILHGLCRQCESELPGYMPRTTKEVAKIHYGVRDKDFPFIPCEVRKRYTLFDRITLENHMIRSCGSKMDWVRDIAKRDSRKKKLNATLHRKEEETRDFLEDLAPGFGAYVEAVGLKETDKEELQQCGQRYVTLTEALKARGLKLRDDSRLCMGYVTAGYGQIESVVDTMEEMNFLFAHTDYAQRCKYKIDRIRQDKDEWYPRDLFREMMRDCRDDAKVELCIEYLENNKGLTLPRKWEKCRQRYESVKASGENPEKEMDQIYGE